MGLGPFVIVRRQVSPTSLIACRVIQVTVGRICEPFGIARETNELLSCSRRNPGSEVKPTRGSTSADRGAKSSEIYCLERASPSKLTSRVYGEIQCLLYADTL